MREKEKKRMSGWETRYTLHHWGMEINGMYTPNGEVERVRIKMAVTRSQGLLSSSACTLMYIDIYAVFFFFFSCVIYIYSLSATAITSNKPSFYTFSLLFSTRRLFFLFYILQPTPIYFSFILWYIFFFFGFLSHGDIIPDL